MQNTYQEKILDLENTNNSINKKLEGGIKFKIKSNFQPAGDQPQAIKKLIGIFVISEHCSNESPLEDLTLFN